MSEQYSEEPGKHRFRRVNDIKKRGGGKKQKGKKVSFGGYTSPSRAGSTLPKERTSDESGDKLTRRKVMDQLANFRRG